MKAKIKQLLKNISKSTNSLNAFMTPLQNNIMFCAVRLHKVQKSCCTKELGYVEVPAIDKITMDTLVAIYTDPTNYIKGRDKATCERHSTPERSEGGVVVF